MALSVEHLKEHSNVTGDADDVLLARLLGAAKAHTARQLGFAIDDGDAFPDGTPEDVEQAILMLAAHWFENREASIVGLSIQAVPFGYAEIIAEHRTYTFGASDE